MPLGFERLNERTTRPNPLINFIKPLPGSSSANAKDFLERIAAQCYPVMKSNYIAVMALEEYPFNTEFIGRNFNAGEVIQLVLRSRSGAWLPFKYVQMTMMHELAHCKQMNHSGAFWKVRNAYADEMRGLWGKKYLGEGLWGKGRALENGRFMHDVMPDARDLPEHTCGGTFRARGRKRKRGGGGEKPKISYAEQKQRRIMKKFGDPDKAVTLGTDEDTRVKLENGKKPKGKPRVAGSNRGRELRAAAALARFDLVKKEPEVKEEDSDTEDEYDWPLTDDESTAIRQDGKDFVRICEAEDEDNEDVKREMDELNDLYSIPKAPTAKPTSIKSIDNKPSRPKTIARTIGARTEARNTQTAPALEGSDTEDVSDAESSRVPQPRKQVPPTTMEGSETESDSDFESARPPPAPSKSTTVDSKASIALGVDNTNTCAACSMSNDAKALVCTACSNVLKPSQMPNHWRCQSAACRGGVYINVGDYGRCQVCSTAKP
jgi:hypothetical protein